MKKLNLTIENKKITIDYNTHFANLVKINQSLTFGARENYQKQKLTYVDVPEIVGVTGACENIDTLFKVGSRLGLPLFFTQTGQLALEQALQSFSSVWTVIHSGRDELQEDNRHLRQFRLTEEEFDCTTIGMTREKYNEEKMYENLLNHIQTTIQSMIKQILQDHSEILKKIYKRNIDKLIYAQTHDFLKVTYYDAILLLQKNGYPKLKFGTDLESAHEAKVVALMNKNKTELPVFIMKYPKEIKFFNMKVSTQDEKVCLSADLIFPYAGEGVGSAVREHEFNKLNKRLITSNMYKLHIQRGGKYADFKWYLDIMRKKATNPHAGYGIGNDRVLQYVFGELDIRNTSIFSLLGRQTGDWNKNRYGQAAILGIEKKHVLLSIGKITNKNKLLPYIQNVIKNNLKVIFYTTENTYKFLQEKQIQTSLVYKISQTGKSPNISDLLARKVFDVIINIPTPDKKEGQTDGQLIRKSAVQSGINPITDMEVAQMILENLAK